jgi:hypothetical protein
MIGERPDLNTTTRIQKSYKNQGHFEAEIVRGYHFCMRGVYDPLAQAKTALSEVFHKIIEPELTLDIALTKNQRNHLYTRDCTQKKGHLVGICAGREFNIVLSQEPESDFEGIIKIKISRNFPTGKGKVNRRLIHHLEQVLARCIFYDPEL